MKNFKKFRNSMKKLVSSLLYESSSGNQVDGLPLALVYKKMYAVDENFDVELLVNHQKVVSLYIKVSKEAIQSLKW